MLSTIIFVLMCGSYQAAIALPFPWVKAAEEAGIDPDLLYALAMVESQRSVSGGLEAQPWPWAVNKAGQPFYFDSRDEARTFINNSLARGITNIDISAFQINYGWHGHRVERAEDLLDAYTSAYVAAQILREAMDSSPTDILIGIGRYHSWDDDRAIQYGARVLAIYHHVKQLETGSP